MSDDAGNFLKDTFDPNELWSRVLREAGREIRDPGGSRRGAEKKQREAVAAEGVKRTRLLSLSRLEQERTARGKSLAAESTRAPKGSARSRRIARNNNAEPASEVLGVEQDFLGL